LRPFPFDDRNSRVMRFYKVLPILVLVASVVSCATNSKQPSTANNRPQTLNESLWQDSRDASFSAENTGDKQLKAKFAQEGIAYADECVMKNPEEAECYYYRGINTGIYYSAHVIGYQTGIKGMIKDCEKVISLNEKLDHGGAYRMMGKIYTDMPETIVSKNGIRRDLDKAISYLQMAVQIDHNYPENHIYLSEAYLEAGKNKEAASELLVARNLTPQWKNHRDYSMWKKMNKELSGKIK